MKIVGLRINRNQRPYAATGDTLLATFDLEYAGLRLEDCTLLWTKRGFPLGQPPRAAGRDNQDHRRVHVIERNISQAMSRLAYDAYLDFGGQPITAPIAADAAQ